MFRIIIIFGCVLWCIALDVSLVGWSSWCSVGGGSAWGLVFVQPKAAHYTYYLTCSIYVLYKNRVLSAAHPDGPEMSKTIWLWYSLKAGSTMYETKRKQP